MSGRHRVVMPIDTRPRVASDAVTMHRVTVQRLADGETGIAAPPPEDLLPSGGSDHRSGPGSVAGADPGFRSEVEATRRRQVALWNIRSMASAASSAASIAFSSSR